MEAFLTALFSFPTVCFTSLLALALLYWITVIVGALDIDFLSPDTGADAAIDASPDVVTDVGGDAGIHHDADVHATGYTPNGIGNFISLGKVPITIIFTFFAFVGWLLGMFSDMLLRGPIAGITGDLLYGFGLFPALVILSFIITGFLVRPFRGMFSLVTEHAGITLQGKMVRITSRTVSPTFGTAICDNAGAGILMRVICRDGVTLKRDEMAVVVEYDEAKQTYLVAPFSHTSMDAVDASVATPDAPATPPPPVSLERREEPPH